MAEKKKIKKVEKKKEEFCEVFEVEKGGKEEIKKVCAEIPLQVSKKDQVSKETKTLRNILIIIGAVFLVLILAIFLTNSLKNFEYKGVKFKLVKEGKLMLYNTQLPVYGQNGTKIADYNFYLRINPEKNDIPFEGNFTLKKTVVLNSTSDFNCDGDGTIGIANMVQLMKLFNVKVIKDENATCDTQGRYTYINIIEANQSNIEQTGNSSCYTFNVNNCEILKVTEKFMLENFADFEKK